MEKEKKIGEILSKREKMIGIHIMLIFLAIPQILIGYLYFKIYSKKSFLFFVLIQILLLLFIGIVLILISTKEERNQYLIGLSLSIIFSFSFSMIFFTGSKYYPLYIYFITLCIYHYSEYFSVLIYHFDKISCEFFLIDHSIGWGAATLLSFAEMIIGTYYFDKYKKIKFFFVIGLVMLIVGQYFRIAALYTGKSNFTHKIRYNKVENHELITHGIYSLSRHPSYFGFFLWSVGIEVMCCNPICTIGFTFVLFNFFKRRILIEEGLLIQFFGEKYLEYKNSVGILIPFIHMDKEKEQKYLNVYLSKQNTVN